MAITPRATGTYVDGTANIQPGIPGGATAGDMMILLYATKPYNDVPTIDQNWGLLGFATDGTTAAGVDVGSMQVRAYWKVHTGSETNPTITNSTNNVSAAVIIVFQRTSSSYQWVSPVGAGGGDATAGTGFSITASRNFGISANDVLVAMAAFRSDAAVPGALTLAATTATIGSVTKSPGTDLASGTGGDIGMTVGYASASGSAATAAPVLSATLAASHTGSGIIVRLREVLTDIDGDVQAVYTATGITSSKIKESINTLITGLKADNTWQHIAVLYGQVGGTAATHKINYRNTDDLDGAFRAAYSGTVTHAATGITGNGSTGYANTFYLPSLEQFAGFGSIGVYLRTNANSTTTDAGASNTGETQQTAIWSRFSDIFYGLTNSSSILTQVANTDSRGWFFSSRLSTTQNYLQKNATQNTLGETVGTPAFAVYMLARNTNGSAGFFSVRENALLWLGNQVTTAQGSLIYTRVQQFEADNARAFGSVPISARGTGGATSYGNLSALAAISGRAGGGCSGHGTLNAMGELSGLAAGAALGYGTIDGVSAGGTAINGVVMGGATASGALTGLGSPTGRAAGSATARATLTATGTLTAVAEASSTARGLAAGIGSISANSAGNSTGYANLQSTAAIQGRAGGGSTAVGMVDTTNGIYGRAAGAGNGYGSVSSSVLLNARTVGIALVNADLSASGILSGNIPCYALHTALLSGNGLLTAQTSARAIVLADLIGKGVLEGRTGGSTITTGGLSLYIPANPYSQYFWSN
jgi:hypothetical protein